MSHHGPHSENDPANAPDTRLLTDGGSDEDRDDGATEDAEETAEDAETGDDADPDSLGSNVDVMEPGEAEPADPKWEPPDIDDVPEFEVRADQPVVDRSGGTTDADDSPTSADDTDSAGGTAPTEGAGQPSNPTAGMPNDAQAPGATTVSSQGTEAYVAALELCARLPEDVRLPEAAADLVPAAVEAELEQDIQNFAAAEFDNARPHVDTLSFEEADGEVWLRIRIGLPSDGFADIDPEEIRTYALQELEGVL